jgi:putative oxidoreductase
MSQAFRGLVTVVGRVLLTSIFLASALGNHLPKFNETVNMMESAGVPHAQIMLAGALVFMIAGGLSVLLGFKAQYGAALLLVFLILATYYFHAFWKEAGAAQENQMAHFMKNVSLMGAMIFIMANGSGPWSVDNRKSNRMPNPAHS